LGRAVGVWREWDVVICRRENDCVWLRQDMRFDDVVKDVEGTIEEGLRGCTLWYSTKYDRKMLMQLQRDGDVGKLVKGNDEFGYMYITERDVPMWKSVHVNEVGDSLWGSTNSRWWQRRRRCSSR